MHVIVVYNAMHDCTYACQMQIAATYFLKFKIQSPA